MNEHLLVSDADNFSVEFEINPYMDKHDQPDWDAAVAEHDGLVAAHVAAGRRLERIPTAPGCPDMVYTANAALVRGSRALLAQLPPERAPELPHYRLWFAEHGYDVVEAPHRFSGQGDVLAFGGGRVLAGSGWRTDKAMHGVVADVLGYEIVPVHTRNRRWYDIDLAVAVVTPELLAWCPAAFDVRSRRTIRELPGVELLEVGLDEAQAFALNLVSDTTTVTMTEGAPVLAGRLRDRGFRVVELPTDQLKKGGGGVRCTALALDT